MALGKTLSILTDNQNAYKPIIYITFAALIFLIHIPMDLISDDAVLSVNIDKYSLAEFFMSRYLHIGRIITDSFANIFYRFPMILWKIFDTAVYVLIAFLISHIFTKNTWKDLLLACSLILLFPVSFLATAGYIAVTANYIYTILGLLLIMYHLQIIGHYRKSPVSFYPISLLSILYATNQDQTAMVLIGGLFLFLIYLNVFNKEKQPLRFHVAVLLILSICSYIFMFTLPGHLNRMSSTLEMETYLPEYADWSLLDKIYHGYTSSVAGLFFTKMELFILLCLMILLLGFHQSNLIKKMIACFPALLLFFSSYLGEKYFMEYRHSMPELISPFINPLPLLLTVIAVGCIFYSAFACIKTREYKWAVIIFLILAAGSRGMMGFSATIYASSYRTYIFFLFACIFCCLIMFREMEEKEMHRAKRMSVGAILTLLFI